MGKRETERETEREYFLLPKMPLMLQREREKERYRKRERKREREREYFLLPEVSLDFCVAAFAGREDGLRLEGLELVQVVVRISVDFLDVSSQILKDNR